MFAFSANIILPANYAETQITLAKDRIATSSSVTDEMIPDLVDYAVVSMQGEFISGNLTKEEASYAWHLKQKGEKQGSSRFYAFIERKQEVCILRYSLVPEYRSAIIRNYLPNPQLTVLLVLLLSCCTSSGTCCSFWQKTKTKMMGLQEAIEKYNIRIWHFIYNHLEFKKLMILLFPSNK